MSTLKAEVLKIDEIQPHPNADLLELARIRGWWCVIKKNQHKAGDLVVYFPIDSVLPVDVSDKFNCTQYLTKQRIRAARLRGVVSCGVIGFNEEDWEEGTDVTEHYKVQKWEPPPGGNTGGQNRREPGPFHHYTGIENWNNYTNVFQEGEEIVADEKIHGTNWRAGIIEDEFVIGSHYNTKALNENVVYWQAALRYNIEERMRKILPSGNNWVLFGEVFGAVQDLRYGLGKEIDLRVFDLSMNGRYLDYDEFKAVVSDLGLKTVPQIYRGAYSTHIVEEICEGKTTMDADHIREGVVIRPTKERWERGIGRVILKKINPAYLVRKGGTEYH